MFLRMIKKEIIKKSSLNRNPKNLINSRGFNSDHIEHKIAEDPIGYYASFKNRLDKQGLLAPFPEFKPTIEYLKNALRYPDIDHLCDQNLTLAQLRISSENQLFHLSLKFKVDGISYPHVPPFAGPYPYLPTLVAIQNTLTFLDACVRTNYIDVPPVYHADRYSYQAYEFFNYHNVTNPIIYFPTTHSLPLIHFIKTRSVPIGFLGVTSRPLFADAYFNSPLDYFIHDVNHARRCKSYNYLFKNKHSLFTDNILYKCFNEFIKKSILPAIEINNGMIVEERHIRQVMRVLYFELVHEYALTPDLDSFIAAYKHNPDSPSPFEHITYDGFKSHELETLRLKNNNIKSGYHEVGRSIKNPVVRYFFDKGPNFLTSAYNKLINGFYDNHLKRDIHLPPMSLRTPKLIVNAAKRILLSLESEDLLTDDELLTLVTKKGFIEIYPDNSLKNPHK